VAAIAAATLLAFGNFLICWQSFVGQGFEQTPLAGVPFLGPLAEALGVGEAPMSALYALVLTGAMNLAVIASAKMAARLIQHAFDYRDLRASGNPGDRDQARQCRERLLETVTWLVPMVVVTALIMRFDVAQFVFRYETLVHEAPDLGVALGWAADALERVGEFLAPFIRTAAWGYVGCIVAVALAVEFAFVRAAERWQRLDLAVQRAISGEPDARTAARGSALAGAIDDFRSASDIMPASVPAGTSADPMSHASEAREPERVPGPPPAAEEPPAARPVPEVPHVDVIVGPGQRRRVPVSDIEARPDEFVRDGTGRAWFLRSYYEQAVLGTDGRKEQAA
jgi:hypothetical protein